MIEFFLFIVSIASVTGVILFSRFIKLFIKFMDKVQQISDAVDALQTSLSTKFQSLIDEVSALQAADNGIDPTLLDPILTKINGLKDTVDNFDVTP
jgi:hypothetical protein